MSKLKAVDSNYFHFLFNLFSFILFLELELGLDHVVTQQSYQITQSQVTRGIEEYRRFWKNDVI